MQVRTLWQAPQTGALLTLGLDLNDDSSLTAEGGLTKAAQTLWCSGAGGR